MNQAKIDRDEWLDTFDTVARLEIESRTNKTEHQVINDWLRRLEYMNAKLEERIQKLEEKREEEDTDLDFNDSEDI